MNLFKLSYRNIIGRPLSTILSVILLATGLSTAIILELTDHQLTKNIENRMRQVKPDNVFAKFYTAVFIKLERDLHDRYKKFRIP